ncbi:hypothetical protein FNF29_02912 [Cafeteria roenbergensis]|nr:hypothetical protein FNF29_02912 [Cafeteria roenbergensis]|eukprot:KAA0153924.1 hypothetical protein FNF29_02912 [Cafeteria roenbergensis]
MRRGMAGRGGTGGSWERSELFAGSSAAAAAGRGDMEEDAAVRAMREENDALTRDLESKADLMSRSATRINHEVRDSMALLQSVGSGVSRARSGVAGAVDGVSKIVAEGGGTLPLCKMVGVMVLLFLVVWFIFLR